MTSCKYQKECMNFSFNAIRCMNEDYQIHTIKDEKVYVASREELCFTKRRPGLLNKIMGVEFEDDKRRDTS